MALKMILERWGGPRVAVFSMISRDRVVYQDGRNYERLGGSSLYIGSILAKLGIGVTVVGYIGNDICKGNVLYLIGGPYSKMCLQLSDSASTKVQLTYEGEELQDVNVEWGRGMDIDDGVILAISEADLLHIGPEVYEKQLIVAEEAWRRGASVVFDPHADYNDIGINGIRDLLRYVRFFFCNEEEMAALSGSRDMTSACDRLFEMGIEGICIMRGAAGAVWRDRCGEMIAVPAWPAEGLLDSVGAGDSFQAGFLAGQVIGLDVRASLKIATFIAARSIEDHEPYGLYQMRNRVSSSLS